MERRFARVPAPFPVGRAAPRRKKQLPVSSVSVPRGSLRCLAAIGVQERAGVKAVKRTPHYRESAAHIEQRSRLHHFPQKKLLVVSYEGSCEVAGADALPRFA